MAVFDVAILGGGPAGCAAAIPLARAGLRCVLVADPDLGPDRIEAIAPRLRGLLPRLGAGAEALITDAIPCPGLVCYWADGAPAERSFIFDPHGEAMLVDRRSFDRRLLGLAQASGARVIAPARALALSPARGGEIRIALDAPHPRLRARQVLLATGPLRRRLDPPPPPNDLLIALTIVGRARPGDADPRLLLEADREGWFYACAGPGGSAAICLLTDRETLAAGAGKNALLAAALRRSPAVRAFADRHDWRGPCRAVPVPCFSRPSAAGPGIARIGAARRHHDPLTGRGVVEAMRDGCRAAEVLLGTGTLGAEQDYASYWQERTAFYSAAADRFNSDFWSRRLPARERLRQSNRLARLELL